MRAKRVVAMILALVMLVGQVALIRVMAIPVKFPNGIGMSRVDDEFDLKSTAGNRVPKSTEPKVTESTEPYVDEFTEELSMDELMEILGPMGTGSASGVSGNPMAQTTLTQDTYSKLWGMYQDILGGEQDIDSSKPTEPQKTESPEVTEPQKTEFPEATEPQKTGSPEATEPQKTESPEVTEPQKTESPEVTEPQKTESPEVTEPQKTESPEATEPQKAESPEATEPQKTESPEATEPQKTESPEATEPDELQGTVLVEGKESTVETKVSTTDTTAEITTTTTVTEGDVVIVKVVTMVVDLLTGKVSINETTTVKTAIGDFNVVSVPVTHTDSVTNTEPVNSIVPVTTGFIDERLNTTVDGDYAIVLDFSSNNVGEGLEYEDEASCETYLKLVMKALDELGHDFGGVYIRFMSGMKVDSFALEMAEICDKLGIPYGFYIWSGSSTKEKAKAQYKKFAEEWLSAEANNELGCYTYPLMLDLELSSNQEKENQECREKGQAIKNNPNQSAVLRYWLDQGIDFVLYANMTNHYDFYRDEKPTNVWVASWGRVSPDKIPTKGLDAYINPNKDGLSKDEKRLREAKKKYFADSVMWQYTESGHSALGTDHQDMSWADADWLRQYINRPEGELRDAYTVHFQEYLKKK